MTRTQTKRQQTESFPLSVCVCCRKGSCRGRLSCLLVCLVLSSRKHCSQSLSVTGIETGPQGHQQNHHLGLRVLVEPVLGVVSGMQITSEDGNGRQFRGWHMWSREVNLHFLSFEVKQLQAQLLAHPNPGLSLGVTTGLNTNKSAAYGVRFSFASPLVP